MMNKTLLLSLSLVAMSAYAAAPGGETKTDSVRLRTEQPKRCTAQPWQPLKASFNVQSDMLLSTAEATKKQWFGNTYVTATLQNNYIEARMRFEDLLSPLPGHEPNKGRGIPYIELTGRYGSFADLTLGDFYEQFGSGIVLRSYEERNLGIDNSIRGVRATVRPVAGVALKALVGQQRNYFDRPSAFFNKDRGYLTGFDLELGIDSWIKALQTSGTHITWGGSFVSKYEDEDIIPVSRYDEKTGSVQPIIVNGKPMVLNLPKRVPTMGTRLNVQSGDFTVYGEYAYKYNDPTADNKYIYRPGSVVLLSASYSRSGLSALLQAKRSENFNSLSKRSVSGLPLHINYLPPFSQQQTYTLAALYPYATQPGGEWAMQGELRYTFKRNTVLGGKYGTQVRLNASHIRGLKRDWVDRNDQPLALKPNSQERLQPGDAGFDESIMGGEGYKTSFFGTGELYFQDINVELSKKINSTFSFTLTYINQIYNKEVIVGHLDAYDKDNAANGVKHPGKYYSNIFIYDGKYKLNRKLQLRTELQFLTTKQGEGNWLFALAELSIQPGLMFTLSDQFNAGLTKKHYYMASVAYTSGAHRVQLSMGRTREGINCSGGVCRLMPATQGLYLSYTGNF